MMLVNMRYPNYPVALGVIRDVPDHTYDDNIVDQLEEIRAKSNIHCVDDLLCSGETWEMRSRAFGADRAGDEIAARACAWTSGSCKVMPLPGCGRSMRRWVSVRLRACACSLLVG